MDLRDVRGVGTKMLNKGKESEIKESAVWNLLLQLHLLTALEMIKHRLLHIMRNKSFLKSI